MLRTRKRALGRLLVSFTLAALAGCTTNVKLVAVRCSDDTLKFYPKTVRVKRERQVVAWGADGDQLKIDFTGPKGNPFTNPVACEGGRFCAALLPPKGTVAYDTYKYSATAMCSGKPVKADPEVEVIP